MPLFVLQGTYGRTHTFIAIHKSIVQLKRYHIIISIQQWLFSVVLSHPFGHVYVYSRIVSEVVEFS